MCRYWCARSIISCSSSSRYCGFTRAGSCVPSPRFGITNACITAALGARELVDGVDRLRGLRERQRVARCRARSERRRAPTSSSPSRGRPPSGSGGARGSSHGSTSPPSRACGQTAAKKALNARVRHPPLPVGVDVMGLDVEDELARQVAKRRLALAAVPLEIAGVGGGGVCRPSRSCRSSPGITMSIAQKPIAEAAAVRTNWRLLIPNLRRKRSVSRSARLHDRKLRRVRRRREVLVVRARQHVDRQVLGHPAPRVPLRSRGQRRPAVASS